MTVAGLPTANSQRWERVETVMIIATPLESLNARAEAAVWVVGFHSEVKFIVALSVEERLLRRARIDQIPTGSGARGGAPDRRVH